MDNRIQTSKKTFILFSGVTEHIIISGLLSPFTTRLMKRSISRLIIAESEQNADMFYATGFRAPDDFIFLEYRNKKKILLSDLEIDRGRLQAKVDHVFSFSEWEKQLAKRKRYSKNKKPSYAEVVADFIKEEGSSVIQVPSNFPFGLAKLLEKQGLSLLPIEGMFFPERQIKRSEEVRLMQRILRITENGLTRGCQILKESTIGKKNQLFWRRLPLTSERLRQEIEETIARAGGICAGTSIVAGGRQACDPHERGYGNLYAHELIILDLFPRDQRSSYYGDLTRTVIKGKASSAQRHLWETCLAGQKMALKALKPRAKGHIIHQAVTDFFTKAGYPTEQKNGRWHGFFHGTGHGLGLDLHEAPRFDAATLKEGHVFTIEPGIYIPGLGGVRHEDVAVITKRGHRLLSHSPKELEL